MALENLTGPNVYISALVQTNPTNTDPEGEGDDHLRGIKNVILNTFPNITGPVTLTQAQINALLNPPLQVPIGAILDFAGGALPANYLLVPLVASTLSRVTYAALFAVIGIQWGPGDGVNTFGIPYIPQGMPALQGASVATITAGQLLTHTHTYSNANAGAGTGLNTGSGVVGAAAQTGAMTPAGGANNMPAGITFQKIIRYQ